MNKNCLVTKLKAEVDNDSLMKLGEIRIPVGYGETIVISSQSFRIGDTGVIDVVSGNVSATVGGSAVSLPYTLAGTGGGSSAHIKVLLSAAADSVVSLTSKYNIYTLVQGSSPNLYGDWDVDLRVFEYSPIEYIDLYDTTKMHGDIKYLIKKTIKNQTVSVGRGFTGKIESFGVLTSIVTTLAFAWRTGITGAFENLALAYRDNERTSGSVTITCSANCFTFKGSAVAAQTSGKTFKWRLSSDGSQTAGATMDVQWNGTAIAIDDNGGFVADITSW